MPRVEVRERIWRLPDPMVRNDPHICIAHDVLAEHLDTMFYHYLVSYTRDWENEDELDK